VAALPTSVLTLLQSVQKDKQASSLIACCPIARTITGKLWSLWHVDPPAYMSLGAWLTQPQNGAPSLQSYQHHSLLISGRYIVDFMRQCFVRYCVLQLGCMQPPCFMWLCCT
jgi:hypothetical protein